MLDTTIHMVALEFVNDLPVMELADEYPLLNDEEERDLIADVEARGVINPLIVFEDQLLDGRNRLAAAIKAELETLPIRYFIGTIEEAEKEIVSQNEKRRHLLPVQRGYIADRHRGIVERRAEERKKSSLPVEGQKGFQTNVVPSPGTTLEIGKTRDVLAKEHNVGKNTIDTVQKIRRVSQETMEDPDSDGEVMTPRAIKAAAVLTKMKKGTITVSDAVKNVFGEPGQDINPDDQTKISSAKHGLGKIITEANTFMDHADVLFGIGNDTDQTYVYQKLHRLTEIVSQLNAKFGQMEDDLDNQLDPEENREYWSEVESKNHE